MRKGNERRPGPAQVSLLHVPGLPEHSVLNHPARPVVALTHNPSARRTFPSGPLQALGWPFWASPVACGLAATQGRIRFVRLRTARSPPVAPHAASRRRSYCRLQVGVCIPEEDLHLSDQTRSQTHMPPDSFRRRLTFSLDTDAYACAWIGVGRAGLPAPPPSEPDVPISGIRLSGRWSYL